MRLRLLLPMLCTASACFLLVETEAVAPQLQEGRGGEPIVCTGDEAIDCAGLSCGDESPCGSECRGGCLSWRRVPALRDGDPEFRPPALRQAALLCDEAAGGLWLFGGHDSIPVEDLTCGQDSTRLEPRGDLWFLEAEGEDARWRLIEAAVELPTAPQPRGAALLLPGASEGRLFLFGGYRIREFESGCHDRTEVLEDLWLHDEAGWHQIPPDEIARPPGRAFALRADLPNGHVLIAAGNGLPDASDPLNDAWEWDPQQETFTQRSAALFEEWPPEDDERLVLDAAGWVGPARGVVAFGGREVRTELMGGRSYDRRSWQFVEVEGRLVLRELAGVGFPRSRELMGAASVPGLGLVAYDGYLDSDNLDFRANERRDETFLLTESGDWGLLPGGGRDPARSHPGVKSAYAMTWCAPFGGPVIFGGDPDGRAPSHELHVLAP